MFNGQLLHGDLDGQRNLLAAGRTQQIAEASPFYASAPPPLAFVIWSVIWVGLVLGAAGWWFERRDL